MPMPAIKNFNYASQKGSTTATSSWCCLSERLLPLLLFHKQTAPLEFAKNRHNGGTQRSAEWSESNIKNDLMRAQQQMASYLVEWSINLPAGCCRSNGNKKHQRRFAITFLARISLFSIYRRTNFDLTS